MLMSGLLSLAADPAKPAKPTRTTDGDPDPWHRRLPDFQADGLPLSEVANALSEKFPEVNFVLDPVVKETMVAMKLRSVTLEDIFTAIGITTQTGSGAIDPTTGIPPHGAVQANKVSDRMVSFTLRQSPTPEITKPICRAFSLARYLDGKSEADSAKALEDVEQVLELCWSLLRGANSSSAKLGAPNLSLHRATKLLVVVGQPDQIEVVQQVIGELEGARSAAGEVLIDPTTGVPMAFGGGGGGGVGGISPDTIRAVAGRYGNGPRATSPPTSPATNAPVESK